MKSVDTESGTKYTCFPSPVTSMSFNCCGARSISKTVTQFVLSLMGITSGGGNDGWQFDDVASSRRSGRYSLMDRRV